MRQESTCQRQLTIGLLTERELISLRTMAEILQLSLYSMRKAAGEHMPEAKTVVNGSVFYRAKDFQEFLNSL